MPQRTSSPSKCPSLSNSVLEIDTTWCISTIILQERKRVLRRDWTTTCKSTTAHSQHCTPPQLPQIQGRGAKIKLVVMFAGMSVQGKARSCPRVRLCRKWTHFRSSPLVVLFISLFHLSLYTSPSLYTSLTIYIPPSLPSPSLPLPPTLGSHASPISVGSVP
jgi:hypothetical protein